jgi:hypothetical protein
LFFFLISQIVLAQAMLVYTPIALCLMPGASTTGFGFFQDSSRFYRQIKISFVCGLLQAEANHVLELPDKKLEVLWFEFLSCGGFPNASTRCSVKCL